MKIKLDENFGRRCVGLLRAAGHDTATVVEEDLAGTEDGHLLNVCKKEDRCLLTLDLDFSNPFVFPPDSYRGIAVVRLPPRPTYDDLVVAVRTFIAAVVDNTVIGKLWIVERSRIRVHRAEAED